MADRRTDSAIVFFATSSPWLCLQGVVDLLQDLGLDPALLEHGEAFGVGGLGHATLLSLQIKRGTARLACRVSRPP